jgi:hypothetical protein
VSCSSSFTPLISSSSSSSSASVISSSFSSLSAARSMRLLQFTQNSVFLSEARFFSMLFSVRFFSDHFLAALTTVEADIPSANILTCDLMLIPALLCLLRTAASPSLSPLTLHARRSSLSVAIASRFPRNPNRSSSLACAGPQTFWVWVV